MIDGVRVAQLLKAHGLSQSELARRVGVTQQTIHKLVTGASRGSTHIAAIARELRTSPAYLENETDDAAEGAAPAPTERDVAEHMDLVAVASIDMAYGMGSTFAVDHVEENLLHFPRAFIESITLSPASSLTWSRGRGDSMSPTISDNDLVLIDRSQRTPREQDAIWALTIGDMAMVKRLRVRGEKVTILSDNDRVPPDEAHPDEVNIVGRVIFIGRRT
jgi:phage repressor protein C with HTH and peptisase S24 domain